MEKKERVKSDLVTQSQNQNKRGREEVLSEYLLALVLQQSSPKIFLDKITPHLFTSPLYRQIFQYLGDFSTTGKFSIKKFIKFVPPEFTPAIDRSFLLTLPDNLLEEKCLPEVEKTIRELKILTLQKKMQEIAQKIRLAEKEKNEETLMTLKETFTKLTVELTEGKI